MGLIIKKVENALTLQLKVVLGFRQICTTKATGFIQKATMAIEELGGNCLGKRLK